MTITDEMVERATDAVAADLLHGRAHGARIRGSHPDNFNIDGHVDLRSIVRAALTAALQGSAVVPRALTAENGAKAALAGDFTETFEYMDDEGDECTAHIPVSWTTIKEIHKAMVAHFDGQSVTRQVREDGEA
jgi:hypothetical protein